MSKFRDSLRNIDWQNIYSENDANLAYNFFLNKYFDIYNSCFSLKKWKHRSMHLKDRGYPSARLQKSIKKKNKLYIKITNFPTPTIEENSKI